MTLHSFVLNSFSFSPASQSFKNRNFAHRWHTRCASTSLRPKPKNSLAPFSLISLIIVWDRTDGDDVQRGAYTVIATSKGETVLTVCMRYGFLSLDLKRNLIRWHSKLVLIIITIIIQGISKIGQKLICQVSMNEIHFSVFYRVFPVFNRLFFC